MIVNNHPRFKIILPLSTMFYFLLHRTDHCTCESARHIGHQSRSIIKHSRNQNWPDSAVKYRWQGSDFDVLYYTAVQKKAFQIKAVGFLKDRWTMDIYHSCTDWLIQQCFLTQKIGFMKRKVSGYIYEKNWGDAMEKAHHSMIIIIIIWKRQSWIEHCLFVGLCQVTDISKS